MTESMNTVALHHNKRTYCAHVRALHFVRYMACRLAHNNSRNP